MEKDIAEEINYRLKIESRLSVLETNLTEVKSDNKEIKNLLREIKEEQEHTRVVFSRYGGAMMAFTFIGGVVGWLFSQFKVHLGIIGS
jgi:fructose-1,6-bisphosphatase